MNTNIFSDQEKTDLIQGLNASIHRMNSKINNEKRHDNPNFQRLNSRNVKIERAKALIEKISKC